MIILPTITTIFDWQGKMKEIKELGLREIALFLTFLDYKKRQELYSSLKDTKIKTIPFVHLRSDVVKEEVNYLIKNYHTQIFNIHTKREYPYPKEYRQYRNIIYIENCYEPLNENEIRRFAGICLDFSHLENSKLFKTALYEHNVKILKKYDCGCSHIGPAKDFPILQEEDIKYPRDVSPHTLTKLSELDYLKGYPAEYFGKFSALEMENSIKEQLKARDYIKKLRVRS